MSEREKIEEEKEVLHYLISCQGDMAHEKKATKPTLEVVNRCFTRHLNFLKEIHDCHAYNVNKHPNKITQREYKTCTHYLFKFSLPAWYKKMPEEVLTFQEKYPDFK